MPDPAFFSPPTTGRHFFLLAHPDDDCFCAGLMRRLLLAGADVYAVWVTSGDARGDAALREAESNNAMEILGLPSRGRRFLRFPNRGLIPRIAELRDVLRDIVLSYKPDYAYVVGWEGGHVDHDLCCYAFRSAIRLCGFDKFTCRTYEFPLYNITGPRCLLRWRINDFPPCGPPADGMPLNQEEIALKRRIMRTYKSQWRDMYPFMLAMPGFLLRRVGEKYRPLRFEEQGIHRPHPGILNYERGPKGTPFAEVAAALSALD